MSEVCSNVLKVISNAYYATLPVKEVGVLILVLGNISFSAVIAVMARQFTHLGTSEHVNGGQCDTGLFEKDYEILSDFLQPPEPLHKLASM
jgi:hypothetical protein